MTSIGAEPMEVVLDSGSAYTYLPELLHSQLVTAVGSKSQCVLMPVYYEQQFPVDDLAAEGLSQQVIS